MPTLFVYGTLLRRCNHPMARFLADRGFYLGEARMPGRLYDLGRYPGAVPSCDPRDWIFGDLYDLDDATLAELDAYENAESPQPSFFDRRTEQILQGNGQARPAFVYWFHGQLPANAKLIASGRYEVTFAE